MPLAITLTNGEKTNAERGLREVNTVIVTVLSDGKSIELLPTVPFKKTIADLFNTIII